MEKNIIIIGSGVIAKALCEHERVLGYVEPTSDLEIILDPKSAKQIGVVNRNVHYGVIGLGKVEYKEQSAREWEEKGVQLSTLIFDQTYVSRSAQIGKGSVVLPFAYVDGKSQIGVCSYIGPNTNMISSTIGDYSHLAPGARTFAGSIIGDRVFIGANSVIFPCVNVGSDSVIGAMTLVDRNIPKKTIYYRKQGPVVMQENNGTHATTLLEHQSKRRAR